MLDGYIKLMFYGNIKVAQNYTHYSMALLHLPGANFHDLVNKLAYYYLRRYGRLHGHSGTKGRLREGINMGSKLWGGESGVPIFRPQYPARRAFQACVR